jgi:SAM-dependent methyltransferase
LLQDSEHHLTTRFRHYQKYLLPQLRRYIRAISHSVRQDFLRPNRFFEFGVGEGVFSAEVFSALVQDGWEGTACDLNDYISDEAKRIFSRYIVGDGLGILSRTPDATYSVTFEMTVLHHLASVSDYLLALREIVRVTAPGGYIIIVETCHPEGNTATLLKNAVLDMVFNDIVNRSFDPSGETRMIPCPLSFLSDEEIINEIERHSARLIEITRIPNGNSVPKRHCSFLFQKKSI